MRVAPVDGAAVRREWSALAEASGNVFATPEFLETWWSHNGGGRPLRLHACRARDGRLVALLPLYLWRRLPLRVLRFAGHGPGDELGPICAPADRPAAAAALKEALAGGGYSVFVGEQLPADAGYGAAAGGRVLVREGSPVIRFEHPTWDDLLAAQSRNFREQARRRERKLDREHGIAYRLGGEADLDTLFRLHRLRWPAGSAFSDDESFQRDFARVALARGWARLWLLDVAGAPAAAWYGFRFAGAESYYQAGRDPAWDRASVGFVLLAHSIRSALEDGQREYRFLRGGEEYKYRFAEDDPGLETVGLARTLLGRAALAAAVVARKRRHGGPEQVAFPGT